MGSVLVTGRESRGVQQSWLPMVLAMDSLESVP